MRVAGGENDNEIARHLRIPSYAVRSHISNILEKMALRSRLQSKD
jgi:DNA-binding NarL/FixJ family response regulator